MHVSVADWFVIATAVALAATAIRPRLHGRNLRPAVLAIAGLAGVLAIVRA